MALSDNARGALYMSVAMASFALNDALMKSVLDTLPLFQAIVLRGAPACALILAVAWRQGALAFRPGRADAGPLALRTVGEIGSTVTFLTALTHLPLANASAILQASPLAVTLGAAWLLREKVGWRRYTAIVAGFAGVLLVVRPGAEGFNVFSLWALGCVGFIVLRDLSTRRLTRATPSLFVTVLTTIAILGTGLVGSLGQDWSPATAGDVGRLVLASVFLVIGYTFGVMTMRVGEIGVVAPFRYSILIWSSLLGFLFFGEVPDGFTLAGAAIVAAAGGFTFWREQQLLRRARTLERSRERAGAAGR